MADHRIKACLNPECECNKNIKKHKYKATDEYCVKCGTKLELVCNKCYKPIIDEGPKHDKCELCIAEEQDKKEKAKQVLVGTAKAVVAIIAPMIPNAFNPRNNR